MSVSKSKTQLKKKEDIEVKNYDVDFLEVLVHEWVRRSIYFGNFRLSNAILKSIAHKFKYILNLKPFYATDEWIEKFRMTYNIKDIHTSQLSDIGYKIGKSTLPINIFNDLKSKLTSSLDIKSSNAPLSALNAETVGGIVSGSVPNEVSETVDFKKEVSDVEIIDLINEIKEECMDVQDIPTEGTDTSPIPNKFDTYESKLSVNDANISELFDIEDELPVCTIFGRKTVENVANIISSNPNSNDETFQPMIVCTDPKNPNRNSMDSSTKDNSAKTSEVEKIKDLISGKLIDTDSNTSNQNEYIDQFIKEIVRTPEHVDIVYTTSTNQVLLKPTPEADNCEMPICKPIFRSIERVQKTKKKQPKQFKPQSDPSPEVIDLDSLNSKEIPLKKPRQKRNMNQISPALPKNISSKTKTVDQTPSIEETTPNPTPPPPPPTTVSLANLQTEIVNQISPAVQQTWDSTFNANITTSNFTSEINSETQPSLVAPGGIMYTFQMAAPNQNQLTMPYISPMTTNLQATSLGQPTTLTPIVLHFNSSMALQTTEMLQGSEMSPAIINLTQTPSISQTSFMPSSIGLTQQTTSTHFTNFMQNQFIPPLSTHVQHSLSSPTFTQIQAPTIVTTPIMSTTTTTTTQQTPMPEVETSNSTLVITPITHIPKCIQTKSKRIQPTVPATRAGTITSLTSSLATLATPTFGLPNFESTKMLPTITTHNNQPFVSSRSTTITSTSIASTSLTRTTPLAIANSTQKTLAPAPMQVTITKKPRLTDPKKGTRFAQRAPLKTQEEVLKCIKLMEDFAMMNENFRLIGFLERLENQINVKKTN